ncbi:aldo/keto reductase [Actomonas aquatica]|uniref:Aldo/keto reductase n=1 Tax=Actomonas aquatica TaxID=2866162 RepID=A0ABZ1C7D8_9BACT|nr:aldo/keto reductase [Opitutus sp. WL0086]WRQ87247.1 aldo/keto reductase [Opitutus sp. WL0086]
MIRNETYTLPNGVEIPKLGLGTWFIKDEDAAQSVRDAVGLGYRHIDTAQAYGNERGVGEGIRTSGVRRDELFVTTKLAAEIKSYEEAKQSIEQSLQTLGLDHIDLMIIHSPQPWMEFGEADRYAEGNLAAWKALEEAYTAGKLRAIGVSNFEIGDLQNLIDNGSIRPMVNQILTHIGKTPMELITFAQEQNILVEAYSPVAHGELLKHETVKEMAVKYGVSVPQLSIRYVLQLGLLPLPKTANPDHMANNADVDFEISAEDMAALQNIEPLKDYGQASVFPVYGGKMR